MDDLETLYRDHARRFSARAQDDTQVSDADELIGSLWERAHEKVLAGKFDWSNPERTLNRLYLDAAADARVGERGVSRRVLDRIRDAHAQCEAEALMPTAANIAAVSRRNPNRKEHLTAGAVARATVRPLEIDAEDSDRHHPIAPDGYADVEGGEAGRRAGARPVALRDADFDLERAEDVVDRLRAGDHVMPEDRNRLDVLALLMAARRPADRWGRELPEFKAPQIRQMLALRTRADQDRRVAELAALLVAVDEERAAESAKEAEDEERARATREAQRRARFLRSRPE